MGVGYKVAKNYTLPLSVVVLVLSLIGFVLSFDPLFVVFAGIAPGFYSSIVGLGGWRLWMLFLSFFGLLGGGWYVGEQMLKRRKFERLIATDKKHEFASNRKELDEIAKRLPDTYRPRIVEKEAQFRSRR